MAVASCSSGVLESGVSIREFRPGDQPAFQRLNEEWIVRYFVLEAKDVASLADPERTILEPGGRIFLAFQDGQAVGCCALLAMHAGEYEVAKMAVAEQARRGGIGRQLLQTAIREARAAGAQRLYLETNRKLAGAIRLYEAAGFRHVPPERVTPSAYARADVYMELSLQELR